MIVLNRIVRLLFVFPLVFIMILVVMVNVKLGHKPEIKVDDGDTIRYELVKELRRLKSALHQNADLEMQNLYPEGYLFLNAVYALAWSSFLSHEEHKKYFEEGHAEIHKAWMKISSSVGKAPFSEELALPYGSFYNGWSSYVLGSKLRLESADMRNDQEVHHFKRQCNLIAKAIQQRTYPSSYHGAAWPADVMLCVASLSMHDRIFEPEYKGVIQKWLTEVKKRLDHHGMIPHAVHPGNGKAEESARGSSMALMLIFLYDIDVQFAREQFQLFNKYFVSNRLGLTGVREYPKGSPGTADIDSGPLLLGFGGAATIVGMQTLSRFGQSDASLSIRNAVEALALPLQDEHHKEYFFGSLPIADAFIAWSHSRMKSSEQQVTFIRFHFYSLLVFVFLSTLFWILTGSKPQTN